MYISECASPTPALSTIERRLSGLAWHYQQRGFTLDRKDRDDRKATGAGRGQIGCPGCETNGTAPSC